MSPRPRRASTTRRRPAARTCRSCASARRLIEAGSYCARCKPRPADPGRIRGRRNQARRARLSVLQGGRCAHCGAIEALELHHREHDPTNDDPANLTMLCRRCHRIAGGLSR
jgi:hypothetical protein